MKGVKIDPYSKEHLLKVLDTADEIFANYGGDNHSYVENALIPALKQHDHKLSVWEDKDEPEPAKDEVPPAEPTAGAPVADSATNLQETNT